MSASRVSRDEQAWRWVLRKDAGDWGISEEAELRAWLDADPKHAGALLEAEAMWEALEATEDVPAQPEMPYQADEEVGSSGLSRRGLLVGSAAMAASIVGGFAWLHRNPVYATAVGEIRRVPLADGSIAAINTASHVAVEFAEATRAIKLEKGEAWFQVAKDRNRPFVVETGRVRVRAIGTAFSVRRYDNGADILVTEGVVEAWADGADGNKVKLEAGQSAFVADNAAIARAATEMTAVDRRLAWRSGKVDFVDDPIGDAAKEFNRYNKRQLVILDPAIADERFDGVFRTDDPLGFAKAVHDSLSAPVDLSDPTRIRIGRPRGL